MEQSGPFRSGRWAGLLGSLVAVVLAARVVSGQPAAQPAGEPAADPALAGEIDAVLARLTAAVVAGDRDAYLAHVDLSDAYFAVEQRHWADDLGRHKPVAFVFEASGPPRELPPSGVGPRVAAVGVTMTYRSAVGHAAPEPGKSASWPAIFRHADPDGDGPAPAGWLYAGEQWESVPGKGFVVLHLAGASHAAASMVVRAFPAARQRAEDYFDHPVERDIQIKLYANMEHLKASVYLSMPDEWLGGWNEPGEAVKFMDSYTGTPPGWVRALAHEYGHFVCGELGPRAADLIPWWVHEGVAEHCAEPFFSSAESRHARGAIEGWHAAGSLADWSQIADYRATDNGRRIQAYVQGQAMIRYLTDRFGDEPRNRWVSAMANGSTLDDATRSVLGVGFDELDQSWRATLAEAPRDKERSR